MTDNCLLDRFTISHTLDCFAYPGKKRAIVSLSDDVSPVFPYLSAVYPKSVFNPKVNCVTIKHNGRIITLYPQAATLAKIADGDDAQQLMIWLQDLCNQTWLKRGEILPSAGQRQALDPMDIYELLPQLNCGDCHQPTCWAFSFELLFGDQELIACPHAAEQDYAEGGRRLAELLAGNP